MALCVYEKGQDILSTMSLRYRMLARRCRWLRRMGRERW